MLAEYVFLFWLLVLSVFFKFPTLKLPPYMTMMHLDAKIALDQALKNAMGMLESISSRPTTVMSNNSSMFHQPVEFLLII